MTGRVLAALLVSVAGLTGAGPASAQLPNGDFELGGANWTVDALPAGWSVYFPSVGGNPGGHALIRAPGNGSSREQACIRTRFDCGEPADLTICGLGYQVVLESSYPDLNTARMCVWLDGRIEYCDNANAYAGWTTWGSAIPCGAHEIAFCLVVEPGSRDWSARFDNVNVVREISVPAAQATWGRVKVRYR